MSSFTDDTGISTTITDDGNITANGISDKGIIQELGSNINVFDINGLVYNDVQLSSILVLMGIVDDAGISTSFTDETGVANNIIDD